MYDEASFRQIGQFSYPTQGWGLTYDGQSLIMSRRYAQLALPRPRNVPAERRSITCSIMPARLPTQQELEYIQGQVSPMCGDGQYCLYQPSNRSCGRMGIDLTVARDLPIANGLSMCSMALPDDPQGKRLS